VRTAIRKRSPSQPTAVTSSGAAFLMTSP
jgi:hypothetical protein